MDRLRPSWQPGFLVPLIIGGALAADLALRALVPLDRVSYRVWEATRTFGAGTPFRPGLRYDRPRVYGNLAALGNQPDLREYHRVVFTSDTLGYHNPPETAGGPVAALLFGSSFAAGTETNDTEGLAAELTRLVGRRVFNAAPGDPAPLGVRALARGLGLRRGVVIYEYFEGAGPPPIDALPPDPASVRCRALLGGWSSPRVCGGLTRLLQRVRVSPLQVYASRVYRRLQNERLLPNPAARRVLRARLANGREILFLAEEPALARATRPVEPVVRALAWLAARLDLLDFDLLVVLVPQKYAVYGPLLADGGEEDGAERYLARLESALNARGIATVNVAEPLRTAARAALPYDQYVYWRDDTHWNARGVRVAAAAVAPALARLLGRRPN
jgi:hypothetical protein